MAWSTSNGNRGYIFLISAMKAIYLVATSAYCISFIASFITSLVMIPKVNNMLTSYDPTTHIADFAGLPYNSIN